MIEKKEVDVNAEEYCPKDGAKSEVTCKEGLGGTETFNGSSSRESPITLACD